MIKCDSCGCPVVDFYWHTESSTICEACKNYRDKDKCEPDERIVLVDISTSEKR